MVLTLGGLSKICPVELPIQKRRYSNFCVNLGNFGLGIAPDVRFGADMPNLDDSIALFAADGLSGSVVLSDSYGWASLLLQLAAIVASAGSGFGAAETDVILNYINSELKVTPAESKRLMAHLSIYRVAPPAMTRIKRQLSKLNPKAREVVASFMIQIALADGIVEPAEVRILEQFFAAMGMDQAGLYSRLHNLGVDTRAAEKPAAANGKQMAASKPITVQFDMDKVAKLRSETGKLSALLEEIFNDAPTEAHGEPETEEMLPEDGKPPLLPLDADHAALLEILIQRPEWTRQELEYLCAERGLMTDGAVETINEASFDKLDSALIEGEDPVTINTDLLIKETP
jgi:tellurite resistance protein